MAIDLGLTKSIGFSSTCFDPYAALDPFLTSPDLLLKSVTADAYNF